MPKEAIYKVEGLNLHLFSEMPLSAKKAEEYLLTQMDGVFLKIKEANPVMFRSLRVHLANAVLLDKKQQELKEKCIKLKSELFELRNQALSFSNRKQIKSFSLKDEMRHCDEMILKLSKQISLSDSGEVFNQISKWRKLKGNIQKRYNRAYKKTI